MAGYSGTPLVKKLGIKPGHCVSLLGAPDGVDDLLEGLPPDCTLARRLPAGTADVILLFAKSAAKLDSLLPKAIAKLDQSGGLWVCWPKKASKVPTDLTEDVIRNAGLAAGLVDNKVCAVDATWSGLRLVVRLRDRAR